MNSEEVEILGLTKIDQTEYTQRKEDAQQVGQHLEGAVDICVMDTDMGVGSNWEIILQTANRKYHFKNIAGDFRWSHNAMHLSHT